MLWVLILTRARCTTLCDKGCQWLATGRWCCPGPPVSSINKIDRHDISEILLKVALKHHQANNRTNIHIFIVYICTYIETTWIVISKSTHNFTSTIHYSKCRCAINPAMLIQVIYSYRVVCVLSLSWHQDRLFVIQYCFTVAMQTSFRIRNVKRLPSRWVNSAPISENAVLVI